MKKLLLFSFLVISLSRTNAQVTSLNEHFNTFCAVLGENYPTYWSEYDIYANPLIAWTCAPSGGRNGTPGIGCNNYDGTTYYVDTAWLFTPQLNLSYYTGSIYLQFDTKFTSAAARLSVLISDTYVGGTPPDSGRGWNDITSAFTPVLDNYGSSDWETHQVDLTPYAAAPLFVAFRYTSDVTGSGIWMIDNVLTTQIKLGLPPLDNKTLPLSVIGNCTSGQIALSYSATDAGQYNLTIYDMTGRKVHAEELALHAGPGNYTVDGLALPAGMYLVKLGNGSVYGTAKAVIQ
jgi:hypothetical protein